MGKGGPRVGAAWLASKTCDIAPMPHFGKRTQFPVAPRGDEARGMGTVGQNARNETNARRRRVGRGLGDERRLCETNPIARSEANRPGVEVSPGSLCVRFFRT